MSTHIRNIGPIAMKVECRDRYEANSEQAKKLEEEFSNKNQLEASLDKEQQLTLLDTTITWE